MGAVIYCLGCGYGHDNLWSCERARVERERGYAEAAIPVAKAPVNQAERYLAAEARKHAVGRKKGTTVLKPKPSVPGAGLEERLAATEKRLAEIRQKQRERTAKWRGKKKAETPV